MQNQLLSADNISREFSRRVSAFCDKYGLIPSGATVAVACSGGVDSLSLLDWLDSQKAARRLSLVALHFEHGIRGAASLSDAEFVKDFCAARQIPLICGSGDTLRHAKENRLSPEMAARELRYDFFAAALKQIIFSSERRTPNAELNRTGSPRPCILQAAPLPPAYEIRPPFLLALGHHADDQAETVLLRLIHGTGLHGLAAMRPKRFFREIFQKYPSVDIAREKICLVRPFLAVSRADIESYAACRQLAPRNDATNFNTDAARRNGLRQELLPRLKEYNPAIVKALGQVAAIAAAADDYIAAQAAEAAAACAANGEIDREKFSSLPLALQQAVLRRLFGELPYDDLMRLRDFIADGQTGQRLDLPQAGIELEYGTARKTAPRRAAGEKKNPALAGEIILEKSAEKTALWTGQTIRLKEVPPPATPHGDKNKIYFDGGAVSWPLAVRTRQAGDVIALAGGGRQKLKDFFINNKIPRQEREKIPLVVDAAGNILWLAGLYRTGFAYVSAETKDFWQMELS